MVLRHLLKTIKALILFMAFALPFSCEELARIFIDCSNCQENDPKIASVKIRLSTEYEQSTIFIYEGNLEDSLLFSTLRTYSNETTMSLAVDRTYTFEARYYSQNGHYYYTIDSATPRVMYDEKNCNSPCYFIYDNVVDLRLKYTK